MSSNYVIMFLHRLFFKIRIQSFSFFETRTFGNFLKEFCQFLRKNALCPKPRTWLSWKSWKTTTTERPSLTANRKLAPRRSSLYTSNCITTLVLWDTTSPIGWRRTRTQWTTLSLNCSAEPTCLFWRQYSKRKTVSQRLYSVNLGPFC